MTRNPAFATLQQNDVDFFRTVLPNSNQIITDVEELKPFNSDWTNKFSGNSSLVLKPASTEQISQILRHCNERRLAVTPQGGNTGLVLGSQPIFDEIVINMSLMNRVLGFDHTYGIVKAEAGCVLEELQNYCASQNHECPIDLGAKGSC